MLIHLARMWGTRKVQSFFCDSVDWYSLFEVKIFKYY